MKYIVKSRRDFFKVAEKTLLLCVIVFFIFLMTGCSSASTDEISQTTSSYGSPVLETTTAPETTAIPVAETTEEISVKETKLSKEEKKEEAFKNECVYLQFEDAYRNPQNYKDKKVHVQGTVFQVEDGAFMISSDYGGTYVIGEVDWKGENFMVGDKLDIYGIYVDATSAVNVLGNSEAYVGIQLVYADRYVESTAESEIEYENTYYNPNMCVINVDDYTTLRQSPDPNADETAKLPLGSYVMSLDSTDDGWHYVMTEDGLEGYVDGTYLGYLGTGY